jgi:hypothetical protein
MAITVDSKLTYRILLPRSLQKKDFQSASPSTQLRKRLGVGPETMR